MTETVKIILDCIKHAFECLKKEHDFECYREECKNWKICEYLMSVYNMGYWLGYDSGYEDGYHDGWYEDGC